MANPDQEAATMAPENDPIAQSIFKNDSPAQEGPSMGIQEEHCTTDRPTSAVASTSGEISNIGDVETYISKPSDYPHSPSKLLLFLSSGTGIHSKNNQIQADKFAREGFLVIMPDQFGGDPAPNSDNVNDSEDPDATVIEQVKLRAAETVQSFMLDMWLARQTPEKVMPLLQKVIAGVKEEFADSVAYGGGIYAVGYCFGGKYVLLLSAQSRYALEHDETKTEAAPEADEISRIKAGALAHGTQITKQDIEYIKAPLSFVCVENDQLFPDEIREAGQKYLEEHGIEHEIKVFPKVPHGFAVEGEYESVDIKAAQSSAFDQMLSWLQKH